VGSRDTAGTDTDAPVFGFKMLTLLSGRYRRQVAGMLLGACEHGVTLQKANTFIVTTMTV
jgi:hypothetical protein